MRGVIARSLVRSRHAPVAAVLALGWCAWLVSGRSRPFELAALAVASAAAPFVARKRPSLGRAVACVGVVAGFVAYALEPAPASPLLSLGRIAIVGLAGSIALVADPSTSRLARAARRAVLVATSSAIALAGAEWFCARSFGDPLTAIAPDADSGARNLYADDRELGHRMSPLFRGSFEYAEYRGVRLVVNEEGYRGDRWPSAWPAGERRVLVIGDSMAMGWGVDRSSSLPSLAASAFRDERVRVVDASTPGHGPSHARAAFARLAQRVAPAVVVASFYDGNDLEDVLRHFEHARRAGLHAKRLPSEDLRAAGATWPAPTAPRLSSWRYWSTHSDVARRLQILISARFPSLCVRSPIRPCGAELLRAMRAARDPSTRDAMRLASEALVAMRDDVERTGARFVVLRFPARVQAEPETLARMLDEDGIDPREIDPGLPGREVVDACRAAGVTVLDLGVELASGGPCYFAEGHLDREGQRRAAGALIAFLREREWLR